MIVSTKTSGENQLVPNAHVEPMDDRMWHVMRATYRRELLAKQMLDEKGYECFVPLRYVIKQLRTRKVRQLVPAVSSLIFVRATKDELLEFKRKVDFLQFYTMLVEGRNRLVTVRDNDMEQFMKVASTYDDDLIYLHPDEVALDAGTPVRIHGGAFDGMVGNFVKIKGKRNKRVVIAIQNVIAVAMAYLSPDYIEVL